MVLVKQVTVHGLASQPNQPDAIRQALRDFEDDLHTGLRVGGPGAEMIVGSCQPPGRYGASTEIILADQVLQVFQKVHVLPYKERSLNKFMAFENRDPFQAKQEQMENPSSTAWHKWCADQYLRLAMEEGEDMDDGAD